MRKKNRKVSFTIFLMILSLGITLAYQNCQPHVPFVNVSSMPVDVPTLTPTTTLTPTPTNEPALNPTTTPTATPTTEPSFPNLKLEPTSLILVTGKQGKFSVTLSSAFQEDVTFKVSTVRAPSNGATETDFDKIDEFMTIPTGKLSASITVTSKKNYAGSEIKPFLLEVAQIKNANCKTLDNKPCPDDKATSEVKILSLCYKLLSQNVRLPAPMSVTFEINKVSAQTWFSKWWTYNVPENATQAELTKARKDCNIDSTFKDEFIARSGVHYEPIDEQHAVNIEIPAGEKTKTSDTKITTKAPSTTSSSIDGDTYNICIEHYYFYNKDYTLTLDQCSR